MKKDICVLAILLLLFSFLVSCDAGGTTVEPIIDANQFSRISYVELVALLGEPEEKDEFGIDLAKNTGETVHGDMYYFENDKFKFIVADDTVVRMTYTSPVYNDLNAEGTPYKNKKSILEMFCISPSKNMISTTDSPYAIRFQLVSDKIADFWVPILDPDTKTFDLATITYNLNYFA